MTDTMKTTGFCELSNNEMVTVDGGMNWVDYFGGLALVGVGAGMAVTGVGTGAGLTVMVLGFSCARSTCNSI